jgi:hypothetical protein
MAFVITRTELRHVLTEQGFTVELWDKPVGLIGDVERMAQPRRCFSFKHLMAELEWLNEHGIHTIGLYKVFPTDPGTYQGAGVCIRWAYISGR